MDAGAAIHELFIEFGASAAVAAEGPVEDVEFRGVRHAVKAYFTSLGHKRVFFNRATTPIYESWRQPAALDCLNPVTRYISGAMDDQEPVRIPITDVFDLHSVPPRDARAVVDEYLDEAHRLGLKALRIVHGRGIGAQRQMVRQILESKDYVADFRDAPAEAGGWGATVVTLAVRA